jgi:2Fe-2S ferredoxin
VHGALIPVAGLLQQPGFNSFVRKNTMVAVIFKTYAGKIYEVDAAEGQSLMEAAISNLVPGILGDCGGSCSCATCHVHIDPAWAGRLVPASKSEQELLEMAIDPDETSRLGCQIRLSAALDGLLVTMPASQI